MDTDTEIELGARFAETLRRFRVDVDEIDLLVYAAHRLADGVMMTGDPEDLAEAANSIESAAVVARVAQERARDLSNDIAEEIARVDVMGDDDDSEGGNGGPPAPPAPLSA